MDIFITGKNGRKKSGPFVYCLEEADNGKGLHLLSIDVESKAKVTEQVMGNSAREGIASLRALLCAGKPW